MAHRILPALIWTAEKWKLLLQERIDFAECQSFVWRVSYSHHYKGYVREGWLFLSSGSRRAARRLLRGLVLGLHACSCVCVGTRASLQCARAASECLAARRPAPPRCRPTASRHHSHVRLYTPAYWQTDTRWNANPSRAKTEERLKLVALTGSTRISYTNI